MRLEKAKKKYTPHAAPPAAKVTVILTSAAAFVTGVAAIMAIHKIVANTIFLRSFIRGFFNTETGGYKDKISVE